MGAVWRVGRWICTMTSLFLFYCVVSYCYVDISLFMLGICFYWPLDCGNERAIWLSFATAIVWWRRAG